jgi:hypothetical protein
VCTAQVLIRIIHGSHTVLWVFAWDGRILVNFIPRYRSGWNTNIRQPILKLTTQYGFHELFLKYCICYRFCWNILLFQKTKPFCNDPRCTMALSDRVVLWHCQTELYYVIVRQSCTMALSDRDALWHCQTELYYGIVRHSSKNFERRLNYCLSHQSILLYFYYYTYQNRNNSWKPYCVVSFSIGWWILVNFIPC